MTPNGTDGHYDAIVVGSGLRRLGHGVPAGRGRPARAACSSAASAYPPGSFPRTPVQDARELLGPERGPARDVQPMVVPGHRRARVGSGLGGGSLIYANVLLRKDERWFVHEDLDDGGFEHWPVTRADLEPHYDRVEKMIGAPALPARARAVREHAEDDRASSDAAERNGLDWFLPPLAVTFANDGRRRRCRASRSTRSTRTCTAAARHLPAVRRMRRRLQLRRQEHARLQLPHARASAHGAEIRTLLRGAHDRAACGRRLRGRRYVALRASDRGPRTAACRPARSRATTTADPQRRHARHDVPAPTQRARASRASAASSAPASAATATC